MRTRITLALVMCFFLAAASASAEIIEKNFFHQLPIGAEAQSWEYRISLPDSAMMQGKVFTARALDNLMGKLAIEAEVLTPTYYYVKVRLPKLKEIPMAGSLKVELTIGDKPSMQAPAAPTALAISEHSATLKPVFTWQSESKYAAIALYDLTEDKTIWERVSTHRGYMGFDEGWLQKDHSYIWAVKASDDNARYSKATTAKFRIAEVDGIVIIIPE